MACLNEPRAKKSPDWTRASYEGVCGAADYRVIVLEDCCAGISVEAHHFSVTNILSALAEVSISQEFLANLK